MKVRFAVVLMVVVLFPLLIMAQTSFQELNVENAPLIQQVGAIQQPNRWQMLDLAWSPNGEHLAMSTNTGVNTIDFTNNIMEAGQHYGATPVQCVDYSPDNLLIAACNSYDGTVFIWDVVSGEQVAAIYTGRYGADDVQFSPDGTVLAVRNREITLWGVWANGQRQAFTASDAYRVQKLATFVPEKYPVGMSFNIDGSLLAINSAADDLVQIWDTSSEEMVHSLQLDGVYALDFSQDGRYLAMSVNVRDLTLYDAKTFEEIRTIVNDDPDVTITDLSFSPNSSLVVTVSIFSQVQVWDVEGGEVVNNLSGHPWIVAQIDINPTGTVLASLGWDDGIRLWGLGDEFTVRQPPTATPLPTSTPTPQPVLTVGGRAYVHTTDGDALNVRNSPSRQGERIAQLANGTPVSILDGPQEADGLIWWKIRTDDGIEGWVVEAVDDEQTLIAN